MRCDLTLLCWQNGVLKRDFVSSLKNTQMLDLYSFDTPNGLKIKMMLHECEAEYNFHSINILKNEQFAEDFLRISPNNKIPALVDSAGPDGQAISLFESGAILIYLGEKYARCYPQAERARLEVLQWLMFQMGGLGPFLGQAHHFLRFAPEKIPYAMDRYRNEAARLYKVMDARLSVTEWLAAGEYSIADIACYPWIYSHKWQEQDLDDYPNLQRWFTAIANREATQAAFADMAERN